MPNNRLLLSYSDVLPPYVEEALESCTNRATFVSDVSVPDDSILANGTDFAKTWRIRNSGSCIWTTAYRVVFIGATSMARANSIPLPNDVAPNQTVEVTVPMIAPPSSGTYASEWRLQTPTGVKFGPKMYVRIIVSQNATTLLPQELAFPANGGGGPCDEPESPTSPPSVELRFDQYVCLSNFPASDPIRLQLTGPNGERFERVVHAHIGSSGATLFDQYIYWGSQAVPGRWRLDIDNSNHHATLDLVITTEMASSASKRATLADKEWNPLPPEGLNISEYAHGDTITVRGTNFPPNGSIQLGWYTFSHDSSMGSLLDSDSIISDDTGSFVFRAIASETWPAGVVRVVAIAEPEDIENSDSEPPLYLGARPLFVEIRKPVKGSTGKSTDEQVNPQKVNIPAGLFVMGSTGEQIKATVEECNRSEGNCRTDWFDSEKPLHSVWLNGFGIGKYEVTNAEYRQCVSAGVCAPAGHDISDNNIVFDKRFFDDRRPVVGVTWIDAMTFCAWVGGRLPTEEEWEKAARGADARRYPWGDVFEIDRANLGSGHPSEVGSYPGGASTYGVMDMAGNAIEWTATAVGDHYILRGGSWLTYPFRGRVTDRGTRLAPEFANYDIGLRCVFD